MHLSELVVVDRIDKARRARDQQALTEAMRQMEPARRAEILAKTPDAAVVDR